MSTELATIPKIMEDSKNILSVIVGRFAPQGTNQTQIAAIVEMEVANLEYLAGLNPKIKECHPDTIRFGMKKVISQNLSFDPDLGLVHVTTRNGEFDGKKCLMLEVKPSVNGSISLYRQAGVLERINPPVLEFDDETGFLISVRVELVVITKTGSLDILSFTFGRHDFQKWEKQSHAQNSRGKKPDEINQTTLNCANPLYSNYYTLPGKYHRYDDKGGIDPQFASTKAVKHALNRAKLDKNPFGSRRVGGNFHEKVVDTSYDDEVYDTYEDATAPEETPAPKMPAVPPTPPVQAAPPPPPPVAPAPVPTPEKPKETPPPVPEPAPAAEPVPAAKSDAVSKIEAELAKCTHSSQVRTVLNSVTPELSAAHPELVAKIKQTGSRMVALEKAQAAQAPAPAPAPEPAAPAEISAADL